MNKSNEIKPRLWTSFVVFASAYSPLAVIFAIQDFNWSIKNFDHPLIVWVLIASALISVIVTCAAIKDMEKEAGRTVPVKVTKVAYYSGELINYSIPYMVSFFVIDLGKPTLLLSFVFFMALMFMITIRTHNTFINPILCLLGYNLYKITYVKNDHEYEDFMLAKGDRPQKSDSIRIAHLSDRLTIKKP